MRVLQWVRVTLVSIMVILIGVVFGAAVLGILFKVALTAFRWTYNLW